MFRSLRTGLLALALLAPGLAARADAMFELCVREQFPDAVLGAGQVPQQFRPLNGCVARSPQQIAADDTFIAELRKSGVGEEALAPALARFGWKWLQRTPASAINRFSLAAMVDPGFGDAWHGIAIFLANARTPPEVHGYWFRRAAESPRGSPGRFADYGRFLVMQGRFAEAVAPLETALRHEPGHGWAMANLATAHFGTGDTAAGCAMIPRILDVAPPPGFPPQQFQAFRDEWRQRGAQKGCD